MARLVSCASIGGRVFFGIVNAGTSLAYPLAAVDNGDETGTLLTAMTDGAGNPITSSTDGSKRRLDVSTLDCLVDIGSPVRITNDGTNKSVAVPAAAKAFVCISEGGETRIEIDGVASATSTLLVPQGGAMVYPIVGGVQTLACFGSASIHSNFRFLGEL